jgi:hypothetical protein
MSTRLKKAVVAAVLMLLAQLVASGTARSTDTKLYTSEPNSIFCETRKDMEAMQRYSEQHDRNALAKLVEDGSCLIASPALSLYLEEDHGVIVKVRRAGMTSPVWTFRKFIK